MKKVVLLSFDVEEFDLPREHGAEISLKEGVEVSTVGLRRIMEVLEKTGIRATFFCTGNYVKAKPDLIKEIKRHGHEIACHGVDHFSPKTTDIGESKKIIEKIVGGKVAGYRQPRMQKINYKELKRCGYRYDSSINPAFIPGRYNNFKTPRKPFEKEGILEISTSVATGLRVPLFWLALHLLPVGLYVKFSKSALKKTGYFATYFHPWEFADLNGYKVVPAYIKYNSGKKLANKLEKVIQKLKKFGCVFETYERYTSGLDKV